MEANGRDRLAHCSHSDGLSRSLVHPGDFLSSEKYPRNGRDFRRAAVIRPLSSHCRIAPSSCDLTHADLFSIARGRTPKSTMSWELAKDVLKRFGREPFLHAMLLLIGVFPLILVVGFLVLSATLTGMTYFVTERTWAIGLQWFVIMIPFATLLSPVVIFLFNFAAESFVILQKRLKA